MPCEVICYCSLNVWNSTCEAGEQAVTKNVLPTQMGPSVSLLLD